jgi:hypothetical protein
VGDALEQAGQVPLGITVPLELKGQVGAATFEFRVTRVMSQGLLARQKHLFTTLPPRVSLINKLSVPLPRRPVTGPETEVLTQHFIGRFQIIGGLGATGTVEQGRGIPPDLNAVHKVDASTEHGHAHKQDCQKYQVESSHRPDSIKWESHGPPSALEHVDRLFISGPLIKSIP